MKLFRKLSEKKIRITGVSTPIGGISLEYDKSELRVAEELLTFLEDRRVLYSFVSEKCPGGVIVSVQEIRERVQEVLEKVSRESPLFIIVQQIHTAVFDFLQYACNDCKRLSTCDDCLIYKTGCVQGLKEFRKQMGLYIENLCIKYNLTVGGPLKSILPNKDNSTLNYGICPETLDGR
jgi:hypothetical protein